MAVIRNTASMMLKGKVGATTYYVAETRQLARQAMNNSNYGESASRTDAQQNRRVRWSNLVNFYSGNKAWMPKAYENLKPGTSIFNRFMQLNINSAQIPLSKSQAMAKIWVADTYRVSQGSLLPLDVEKNNQSNRMVFPNVTFQDTDDGPASVTTVANLSAALLNSPYGFAEGDALVLVAFFGTLSENNVMPASYRYLEIVLNTSDTTALPTSGLTFSLNANKLQFGADDSTAVGYVAIHTRKSGGKLLVSTQDIVLTQLRTQYWDGSAHLTEAIKSYGESSTVPLSPGGSTEFGSGNDSSTGGGSAGGGGSDDGDLGD